MGALALQGGEPVREEPFPTYNPIGREEKRAVAEVMDDGVLSGFLGTWSPEFYGGARVQGLERDWAAYYGVAHAVSVSSATSALSIAIGAVGVGPGDEVIVSPYSMSASASCVLVYNAIPVFADISPDTFCLDPEDVRRAVTERTKAIVVVDLFGHPFEAEKIRTIAGEFGLKVIEDAAQAYGASYRGRPAGTLGDIGVFSLNFHKTIHCGEGGVCVTQDEDLGERLQLIRNHAEVVVGPKGVTNIANLLGFNYRMTELQAAIAREQLKKLASLVEVRRELAEYLSARLKDYPALTPPSIRPGTRHGFYAYAVRYSRELAGVPRSRFAEALRAEGIPTSEGYVEPIYLQPLYQQRLVYGTRGCPFSCSYNRDSVVSYEKGICPVAERMYEDELLTHHIVHQGLGFRDMDDILSAYDKVMEAMAAGVLV